jgi:hypothetical protein
MTGAEALERCNSNNAFSAGGAIRVSRNITLRAPSPQFETTFFAISRTVLVLWGEPRALDAAKDSSRPKEQGQTVQPALYDRTRLQDVSIAWFRLLGVSIGSLEICIFSLEHMAFDIGRCPLTAVRMQVAVFRHLHIDHVARIPFELAIRKR